MARGTGYFGTHTCVELPNNWIDVMVLDNFCNSHPLALARVEQINGKKPALVQGDILSSAALGAAFRASGGDAAVIEFAGLNSVVESVQTHWPITTTMWRAA